MELKRSVRNFLSSHWPMIIGLLAGLYFFLFNTMGLDLEYFTGDLGDGRFNNYILEHGFRYITGDVDSYWNAPFLYPEPRIITYSDNLLGTLPIYAFFRMLSFDRETAYQLWTIAIFALNFLCSYAFFKWMFKNPYAATLAAYVFTFSMAVHSQLAHAQMYPRFYIPLAIWAVLLFYQKLDPRYLLGAMVALVLQFYSGLYLGFLLTIPVSLIILIGVFGFKIRTVFNQKVLWWWMLQVVAYGFFALIMLLPLVIPYYELSQNIDEITYASVIDSVPTIRSFFYSIQGTLFWDFLDTTGKKYVAFWDHMIFPGGTAMLSMLGLPFVLSLRKKFKFEIPQNTTIFLVVGCITFVLFFRYQGYSLYSYIYEIPGYSSMRSLTRIINVELLFFGFAVGLLFLQISKRFQKIQITAFVLLLGILILDNYTEDIWTSRTNKVKAQNRIEELKSKMIHIPKGSVVSYEPGASEREKGLPAYFYQLDMMLASQELDLICINGYTARAPWVYDKYWDNPIEETRQEWLDHKGVTDTVYVIQ